MDWRVALLVIYCWRPGASCHANGEEEINTSGLHQKYVWVAGDANLILCCSFLGTALPPVALKINKLLLTQVNRDARWNLFMLLYLMAYMHARTCQHQRRRAVGHVSAACKARLGWSIDPRESSSPTGRMHD